MPATLGMLICAAAERAAARQAAGIVAMMTAFMGGLQADVADCRRPERRHLDPLPAGTLIPLAIR
jgi:hypothetical protein